MEVGVRSEEKIFESGWWDMKLEPGRHYGRILKNKAGPGGTANP